MSFTSQLYQQWNEDIPGPTIGGLKPQLRTEVLAEVTGQYEDRFIRSDSTEQCWPALADQKKNTCAQSSRPLRNETAHSVRWSVHDAGLQPGGESNAASTSSQQSSRPRRSQTRGRPRSKRHLTARNHFDRDVQYLKRPSDEREHRDEDLQFLATTLGAAEQDFIFDEVNKVLSKCGHRFFAKHQFAIPLQQGRRLVEQPQDRDWCEWVALLQDLTSKRRVPTHVLHNRRIKELSAILNNSAEITYAIKHRSRPLKDDRNILQLVSSALQVAMILKDRGAMVELDRIYVRVDTRIRKGD